MNMFKKKNKVRDDDTLASLPSENGTNFKTSRGMTKKKKKIEIEERPVFNLDSALPKTDDFRTSLIMPTLSTRFSMLREQDDPNTKLGKASDDSVLFPKRVSRLNLFGHNQLSDIAEVESIHTTFKPPFADDGRNGSISDGYASDDGGSIMNRSRPSEGNNLFGGRQKLYQIATNSAKDLHSASSLMSGKHTYASDVALSPYQQMRLKEKELQQGEPDEMPDRDSLHAEADELDVLQSSANSFSKNRGTQSSTNSGPSNQRTSTAATSVVSESPVTRESSNGAVAKPREQDTNSSVESVGFSASPNFRKKRDETGRSPFALSQSRSAANLRETYSRPAPTMGPPMFRGMSPPPSTLSQPTDSVPRDHVRNAFGSPRFKAASPTIPVKSEQEDAFTNSLQPSDRGKATAMGLFNKPQKKYDEQQFQQRQIQMHEGRNSPYTAESRSESRSSPELNKSETQSLSSPPVTSPKPQERTYTPQIPPIPSGTESPIFNNRGSQSSTGPKSFSRPRTKSVASTREATVKARVESLIKRQNAELAALEAAQLGPTRSRTANDYSRASPEEEEEVQQRTFFDNSDASDDERQSRQQSIKSTVSRVLAPTDIHPALRDGTHDFDFETQSSRASSFPRQSNYSTSSKTDPAPNRQEKPEHGSVLSVEGVDSPTLGPSGLGLSGLIRTHLRHDSDRSSIMRPQSSLFPPPPDTRVASTASDPRTATESVKSDPFELENHRTSGNEQPGVQAAEQNIPAVTMSQKANEILGIATAIKNASEQATPRPSAAQSEAFSHQRNESTETQREQQRFDQDLAERRRKIQDQLKSVQERSRSRSPVGERVVTPNASHGILGKLPGKTSPGEPHGPSKAMKMLGIAGQPRDPSHASSRPRNNWTPEFDRRPEMSSRQDYRASPTQDADYFSGRYTPNGRPPIRAWTPNENTDRPHPPRSTTPSGRQNRHRANSAVADRAPSRNRQYPQTDFEPPMPGRFPGGSNTTSPPPRAPGRRMDSPGGRRPSDRSGSAAEQRREKNGYTSPDVFVPPHNGSGFMSRESPRPSPTPGESPHQAPISMPMSPPLSALHSPNPASVGNGRMTPTLPGRAAPAGARKKSIVKAMISDPTFVSSTSSVPLVNLPQNGGPPVEPIFAPPVPAMNPRRRGNIQGDSEFSPHPAVRPAGNTLTPMSETKEQGNMSLSAAQFAFDHTLPPSNQSRPRNRLRKSSSEGGNMAARARQQALMDEMSREKDRSPHVAVFPNRSATTLIPQDGGMF